MGPIQFLSQYLFEPLVQLFLRLIFIMVMPVLFCGFVLGVDRFLDWCRTPVNVDGDLVIATIVDCNRHITSYAACGAGRRPGPQQGQRLMAPSLAG